MATTVTVTETLSPQQPKAPFPLVKDLIAEYREPGEIPDWLLRLQAVGLDHWPLETLNDWAWDFREQRALGVACDAMIVRKSIGGTTREEMESLYRATFKEPCVP